MSDVSEHDSDSDTETKLNEPVQDKSTVLQQMQVAETTNDDSADIVEDLKRQSTEIETSSENQPEWQKYLEQNQQSGDYIYTDPNDGTVYEWDAEKRGWIPKIDDDFIAMYQANYGFTATGEHDPNVNVEATSNEKNVEVEKKDTEVKSSDEKGKKRKQDEKAWFDIDPKTNNNVYVSGLPHTTTDEEFITLMTKCGIIMNDEKGNPKIKLYKTEDGKVKGDGRCCYLKHESVVLACDFLDESNYNGYTIKVEAAVFQQKGDYNPALKPKKKKKKKVKGKGQDKLLDWVDRPAKRSKFDRIVILKNMFNYLEFEKDPTLIIELKTDLRSECEKYGEIKKVLIFDRNPEGIASILFREPEFADKCIESLNGRYYAGRVVSAETYDGVTNYQVQETEEELEKRLHEWERFIEDDEEMACSPTKEQAGAVGDS